MKQRVAIALVWLAGFTVMHGAEKAFSKTVRAADFSAAGLAKLSPEELARLDALVRDYQRGITAAAEAKVVRAETETKVAQERAVRAETKEKKPEGGLLAKAKVLLAPGTEVEYATTESRIVGDFSGWEGRTVFTLENGQRWQVANGGSYYTPKMANPKVKVVPGALGGFWMTVEGVATRVKVLPLGGK